MNVYTVKRVDKQLAKLDAMTRQRLQKEMKTLEQWPNTQNIKALDGQLKGSYRLRVGDWRILFYRDGDALYISDVKNRKEAY